MAIKKQPNRYDEDQITVLKGLEGVRRRPGMYVGSTDTRGLHQLVWEIIDNAIDEALAGYCTHITVTIHKDNSVTITDNGRGIPTGMHKTGEPTPQVVFCTLHAGGKFDASGGYKVSGGLHGVGSSAVNALSEWLELTVYRGGKTYFQKFEKGGTVIRKPKSLGATKKTGTSVTFKADPTIFSTTIIDYKKVAQKLREAAFLVKGLKNDIYDERSGASEMFQFEAGIAAYLEELVKGRQAYCEPIFIEGENLGIQIEAAFLWCEKTYNETLVSFVNNIRTSDGGTHETGFKTGLTRAFNDYARKRKILKETQANIDGMDIREGMVAILSLRIPEDKLQFEGQTKAKLGSPDARAATETIITEQLGFFLAEKGEIATALVEKSLKAASVREAARKARDSAREIKAKIKKPARLDGKLVPTTRRDPEKNELFLVEGDSAGGSAKQGRDSRFQAILPLRGKVINAERTKPAELIKNEEILSIISAIGAGFGNDFNYKKSAYGKIIIMTDADTDGAHIQVLLLTFFFRYMLDLIRHGYVYLALPPLYKVATKSAPDRYAWTDEELRALLQTNKNSSVQRFKGLGEMNADQLWETTMNPATRTLIQVQIDDFPEADELISVLMGDDVAPRKEWIEANVSFEYEDNFTLEEVEVGSENE